MVDSAYFHVNSTNGDNGLNIAIDPLVKGCPFFLAFYYLRLSEGRVAQSLAWCTIVSDQ